MSDAKMDSHSPIDRALELHSQGRLQEAEALYRDHLRARPADIAALEGHGVILFQMGRIDEAASLFERGLACRPDSPRLHAYLGEALRVQKRFDVAYQHLRQGLTLDPTMAHAWNGLGLLAYDQGQYVPAETAYRHAIKLAPKSGAIYNNLGNVLIARRRFAAAAEVLRVALRLEPGNTAALLTLGRVLLEPGEHHSVIEAESVCLRAVDALQRLPMGWENLGDLRRHQGRINEAMDCYQRAANLDPRRSMPYLLMGRLLRLQGDLEGAARMYDQARALEPNRPLCHSDTGGLWLDRGNSEEAARSYRVALSLDPRLVEAHHGLGLALLEQGRYVEAEASFREALRISPELAATWACLARIQAERGELDTSCESARVALRFDPGLPDAYCRLAANLKGRLPDHELQALERMLNQESLGDEMRASLHFCLGAVLDARELYERAAPIIETANRLRTTARAARGRIYEPDRHSRFIDAIIACFTPDFLARRRDWGDPDPRPVFVVGLPRSGTTLVEQILASHSQIHGAGERADVLDLFQSLPERVGRPAIEPIAALQYLDRPTTRTIARRYLEALSETASLATARIVDKMPENFSLLGWIALLWPRARVIVCRRDLRDIAVSCRQTDFTAVEWAGEWEHLARRFADHLRISDHWKHTRPMEWLDVRYEDLVVDFEPNARRLVAYLDLDWEPACLEFHGSRRAVRTASMVQVRQPIHSGSVGRWKNYESMLLPFYQALERLGVDLTRER